MKVLHNNSKVVSENGYFGEDQSFLTKSLDPNKQIFFWSIILNLEGFLQHSSIAPVVLGTLLNQTGSSEILRIE